MRELLNHLHAKLFNLQLRIDFSNPLPEDILQDLQELQHRTYYFEHLHLESKFKHLKRLASPLSQPPPTQFKLDSVLNLSSRQLSNTELKVLSLGFKFRPSLPILPIQDYILATETYILKANLDDTTSTLLRNAVFNEISKIHTKLKYTPQKSNLSPEDRAAINTLKHDDSIIIIPADKGNKTVILDKASYLEKLWDRIKHHDKVNADPTTKLENSLNSAIDKISKSTPPSSQKPSPPDSELILPRSSLH